MYLNIFLELSLVLDNEIFREILDIVFNKSGDIEETEEGYIDQSLASKGILVAYRDSRYKKKVKLIINTRLILDSDSIDPDKLIRKIDKRIGEYFGHKYRLNDFYMSKITLIKDIDVNNRKKAAEYIKVLQRIGRVKGFSPSAYEGIDKCSSFCLSGNSNGIEFLIYDLQRVVMDRLSKTGISQKKLKSRIEELEGVLRVEVRLTKPKAIRAYTDATDVSGQIATLLRGDRDIFFDIFTQVVPFGDFYKKDKAVEMVRREVEDSRLRRRMLQLLTLIPEKKSLYLAQKAMNCRNIEKVMNGFAKLNLSPVAISKRQDMKYLKSLYEYLPGDK